jgi:acetylornithine/N-succinyldiaminopimelate aminotransferase
MIPSILPTYNRAPLSFERGEGTWLVEADGTRYLDLGAGIAVNALGHAHPALVEALTEQAGKLWHTSNLYRIPKQQELADRLVEKTFADTVFFTNSGTEACELAVKMVRKYWYEKGDPDRIEIVTFEGSFHGRSSAAIAAAGSEKMTKGFGPLLPGFVHLPWGDHEALEAAVTDRTAAILIEPVQGEGGIRPSRTSA